jgi:FRG domain
MTTIERALVRWNIPLAQATSIEFQTIREFRRRLGQPEYDRVQGDTLHCLALMQHHGAPTRLLDCTYSPFVAAAFAMENGIFSLAGTERRRPVVWCFNGQWCEDEAKKALPPDELTLIDRRNNDARRNDETFIPLFQIRSSWLAVVPKWKFVKNENPLHLNERLTAQQGAFLCPADLGSNFMNNLKAMDGCDSKDNLRKLCLELSQAEANTFARKLKDMNISFAALFPGLDGFAKSINQQIGHYNELAQQQAGLG